ncbi:MULTISPECIES: GNAT family N-acetyltransferase [Aneurinibacillus]|uniref:GNAT family N-acetyltransferase n=1 Tax=Aneurinibacillus thermoaerophilus TaxID=143495 RepID=A0A1G8A7F1_ANETH|nr:MULTISPECIES: GNAT family N-acetyltransferase [Aneurinibacillus]AMA74792.1 GCN5 family acetyltransferase [Aneurinibacillus sp. XH2]MED0675447.1 GNAT family N-acetyltransferase [Aneurinibacillus thermoaerophilus]MED0678801.1 GNAT family N-acetyltransferase [Aneurinibacillus thermoaerophilus]MED0736675.1 GNAT family N-acetyltransferase [Aneurinibacillus thermoaerophilus]MED0758329.1 GNAT family N-acetyltransferase [Aneurinibacillus thermoaerophilus]
MLIRSFRLGDYAHITRIWEETGLERTETETLDALAKQLAWDSELVMVAEYEGEVAGVIVGTIDGTRGYFYRLAVNPALQGHGIGRKLVEALEKRFKERGVTRVFIMVNQDNKKVLPFYSSLGYEVKEYITLSKKLTPNKDSE